MVSHLKLIFGVPFFSLWLYCGLLPPVPVPVPIFELGVLSLLRAGAPVAVSLLATTTGSTTPSFLLDVDFVNASIVYPLEVLRQSSDYLIRSRLNVHHMVFSVTN